MTFFKNFISNTIFPDAFLHFFAKYNIIPCRIWLSLGLCCFSSAWRTPSLKGNTRRHRKQKPINSSSIGGPDPVSRRGCCWLFIISSQMYQDLGLILLWFRISLPPPFEFCSFGFTWIKLLAIILYDLVITALGTIFQLDLSVKNENKRMRMPISFCSIFLDVRSSKPGLWSYVA